MDLHGFLGLNDPIGFLVCVTGFSLQVWMARKRRVTFILSIILALFLFITYLTMNENLIPPYRRSYPPVIRIWIPGLGMMWSCSMVFIWIVLTLRDMIPTLNPKFNPERRNLLQLSTGAFVAAPFAAGAFGIVTRKKFVVNEVDVKVPSLPKDLANLRLVQLSDIHLSPFYLEQDLAHVVGVANDLRADVAIITGDLITDQHDPLDRCLLQLSRLKASSGIWGCMGNHERFADAEDYAELRGRMLGINVLRHKAARLKFGAHAINLVGVDYQSRRSPYLAEVEELVNVGDTNVLLSHNPDVFPAAISKGFDLVLAGHTHGGQINVEILDKNLNLADFSTQYTKGLYTEATSSIYVNSGLGTIGMPVRLGAPPEVTLIRLCAS